ncbi:MAG: hypothetical protein FWC87_09535, partial [Acidimicrobiaceae bacterium]|nr:hypothetical protein [Acidimicrobiaceae bacterium]
YLYPGPASSRTELMVGLAWSGLVGILMVIGLFIDHGWVGRIGALIVLAGLVLPLWVRAVPALRRDRN